MERSTLTGAVAQPGRKVRIFAGPLAWLWLLAFCAGTGAAALLWLTSLPPLPDCKHPESLGLDADKLFCIEQAARSGEEGSLVAGLDLVKNWSADHPLHNRATQLMEKWSASLLERARTKAIEADLKGAIDLAQKIPPSSPTYKDARAAIETWQKDLNQGQAVVDSVQAAMKARDWGLALKRIRALSKMDNDYWLQQVTRLRQQISAEEIAANQLQKARQIVKEAPGNIQALGQAIALAEQIDPETYAHEAAKSEIKGWMEALYATVADRLSPRTGLEGATAAVRRLPPGVPAPDVRDILWFSRAQPLVTDPLPRGPLYKQLWQLWVAFSEVSQIRPNSPLYSQTKAMLPKLQMQIQDVAQLNAASTVASLGQIPAFQVAIQAAQGITPERPRRIYAQTLITMWQKEIERVQDRPYLTQAQQFAAVGSPEALRQAISYAKQIYGGRSLYPEAQKAIAQWNRQIQVIEDEPTLKQAQALAKQQRLDEAVQVASKIRAGRALYREAQTAISEWVYEIQIAEDQPLLNRANDYAAQDNLTAAISTAAQIRAGRALYNEAQRAIATWTAQQQKARQSILEKNDLQTGEPTPFSSPSSLSTPEPQLPSPGSQIRTISPSGSPRFSPYPSMPHSPMPPQTPEPLPPQTPSPRDYPVETYEVPPP